MKDPRVPSYVGTPANFITCTCSWFTFWHIDYLRIFVISYVIFFFSRIVEFHFHFQHIEIKELVDLSHQTDQRHRAWDTQAEELI